MDQWFLAAISIRAFILQLRVPYINSVFSFSLEYCLRSIWPLNYFMDKYIGQIVKTISKDGITSLDRIQRREYRIRAKWHPHIFHITISVSYFYYLNSKNFIITNLVPLLVLTFYFLFCSSWHRVCFAEFEIVAFGRLRWQQCRRRSGKRQTRQRTWGWLIIEPFEKQPNSFCVRLLTERHQQPSQPSYLIVYA